MSLWFLAIIPLIIIFYSGGQKSSPNNNLMNRRIELMEWNLNHRKK